MIKKFTRQSKNGIDETASERESGSQEHVNEPSSRKHALKTQSASRGFRVNIETSRVLTQKAAAAQSTAEGLEALREDSTKVQAALPQLLDAIENSAAVSRYTADRIDAIGEDARKIQPDFSQLVEIMEELGQARLANVQLKQIEKTLQADGMSKKDEIHELMSTIVELKATNKQTQEAYRIIQADNHSKDIQLNGLTWKNASLERTHTWLLVELRKKEEQKRIYRTAIYELARVDEEEAERICQAGFEDIERLGKTKYEVDGTDRPLIRDVYTELEFVRKRSGIYNEVWDKRVELWDGH